MNLPSRLGGRKNCCDGIGGVHAAAEHYNRAGGDRDAQIDQTVNFILGGIEVLRAQAPN